MFCFDFKVVRISMEINFPWQFYVEKGKKIYIGAISPGNLEVIYPKIIVNFSGSKRSFTIKENPIGYAVCEILCNRQAHRKASHYLYIKIYLLFFNSYSIIHLICQTTYLYKSVVFRTINSIVICYIIH